MRGAAKAGLSGHAVRLLVARWAALTCFLALAVASSAVSDELRVVAYNTANHPNDPAEDAWFRTVFEAIGNESVSGVARPPDIVALCETDTGSAPRLAGLLDDLYGVTTYNVVTSSHVGGDRTGVVYDSATVVLVEAADLTAIGTHPVLRARFRPLGHRSPESDFYVYAVHLQSGDGASDKAARAGEAANLRADADALGEGAHILFAGDFNMLGSSEGAWTNLLAAGPGQAFDTANSPGEWRDNEAFKALHSQNPRGPMDDRFDIQFVSGEFLDGQGLDYIAGSYRVFGNTGTHTLNGPISSGTGASPTVLEALEDASDHLPVVADYHVPQMPDPLAPGALAIDMQVLAGGQLNPNGPAPKSLGVVGIDPNGNPPETEFAIRIGSGSGAGWLTFVHSGPPHGRDDLYPLGDDPEWHTAAEWAGKRLRGLAPHMAYTFYAKARNPGDQGSALVQVGDYATNNDCDVNRSGLTTALDYAYIKVAIVSGATIGLDQPWACDVNDSGAADVLDLSLTRYRILHPLP